MQSEQVKSRFGRCPYCRAMIYQDLKAVVFYCSKCRTPIRGKKPEPTDETEYALSQLEILSCDTMSVFSDESEPSTAKPSAVEDDGERRPRSSGSIPYGNFDRGRGEAGAASSSSPYRGFNPVRTGPRSGDLDRNEETEPAAGSGSPLHSRVSELRPASRRTRRPMSADLDAPRDEGGSSAGAEPDVPRAMSASCFRRRASPLSSQELEASAVLSGIDPAGAAARSPLTDPAFQKDLLQALDNLRNLIAAVEEPYRADGHNRPADAVGVPRISAAARNDRGTQTVTRRNSRLLRRLESQLVQALPTDGPPSLGTSGSLSSSASATTTTSSRRAAGWRNHCRPVLGGTPFVVCSNCSEILQLPTALSADGSARLQCGGCEEVLSLTLPANGGGSRGRPRKIFSAPQAAVRGGDDAEEEYMLASARRSRLSLSEEQQRRGPDEGPLHRVLGYSSVSSVLRSRRYGDGEHS